MSSIRKNFISRVFLYTMLAVSIFAFVKIMGRYKWKDYTSVKESQHFVIYGDTNTEELKRYYNFLSAFKQYFEKNFFVIGEYKKLKIFVFSNQDNYYKYIQKIGTDTPYGFYIPKERLLIFNESSGIGTLLHEVVHHFNHYSGKKYPSWFNEGLAAFFEKFIAELKGDNTYTFSFGYFSPWRFEQAYNSIVYTHSSMNDFLGQEKPDQSLARSFILFMYKKGLLNSAIDKITLSIDDKRLLEGIFNKKIEQIEEEWSNWVKNNKLNPDVQLIDSSSILTTEELAEWIQKKNVIWDSVNKIYTAH